jgi:hypothetical protein
MITRMIQALIVGLTGLLASWLAGAIVQPPDTPDGGSVSTGFAADLRPSHGADGCTNPKVNVQPDVFPTRTGTVKSSDGRTWIVPGPVHDGGFAVDLYNDCSGTGDNPDHEKQLQTVVIDPDGVEITGYIFADNYYELYVNGRFVARDRLAMTPFNSTVVRFRARYPMTYAIKAIDWETRHGVGMEYQSFNIGDGGFIAYFSDGNRTSADWQAETFYIAPLDDPHCVRTRGGRDSTFCSQAVRPACAQKDPGSCRALHFEVPADWAAPRFDDRAWPAAIVWRPVEVTNAPAYVNYREVFKDADFIWTRNIRLDNLVLARFTAKGPRIGTL